MFTQGGPMASVNPPPVVQPFGSGTAGQMFQFFGPAAMQHLGMGHMQMGQFSPRQSFYDQQQGLQFQQQQMMAMQAAASADQPQALTAMLGIHRQLYGSHAGAERAAQYDTMSQHLGTAGPLLMQLAGPDNWNKMFGPGGSSQVGALGMMQGGQLLADPTTGARGFTGAFASELLSDLMQGDPDANAGKVGMRFAQMARFGMIGSSDLEGDRSDLRTMSQEMKGVMQAAKEIFGVDKSTGQLFQGVQNITQGGLNNLSPEGVENMLRETQATMSMTGLGLPQMMGLQAQAAATADRLGLDRGIVPGMANRAALFGTAVQDVGATRAAFGQSSVDKLRLMDQQVRAGAAASPLVNQLAAVVGLQEAGLIDEGSDAFELAEAIKRGDTEFGGRSLAHMTTGDVIGMLGKAGVDADVATAAIRDQSGNQEVVQRHHLDELGRSLQLEADVIPALRGAVSGGIRSRLRAAGIGGQKAFNMSGSMAEAAIREVFSMDPKDQSDPKKRAEAIQNVLSSRLAAQGIHLPPAQMDEFLKTTSFMVEKSMNKGMATFFPGKSAEDVRDLFSSPQFEQQGGLRIELGTEADLRKALGGIGQEDLIERFGALLQESGEGADIDWKDALGRMAGAINMDTKAGKSFTKAMDQFREAERLGGRLTAVGIASREDAINKIREVAPQLERASSVPPPQQLQPSKDESGAKPRRIVGKLKLIGDGWGEMDASEDLGDPETATPVMSSGGGGGPGGGAGAPMPE